MNKPTVLIVDDESQIRKLLEITLQSNDYNVILAETGKEGLTVAAMHPPDLVILDIGLPDQSGHDVLRQLREWYSNPVVILSAYGDEADIVRALDNGANDYLVKPFRTGELLARLRSAVRSSYHEQSDPVVKLSGLEVDLAARVVKKADAVIKLTATEYSLLALMVRNEGKVLTHQYLLREIWGPGYREQSQYLRVYVAQLRKKIEDDPNRPQYIITESGIGYRFTNPE